MEKDGSSATSSKPEKALRKLIWQLIKQMYSNSNFARLLVLDLLRNINFYSSNGYKHLKEFREKVLETIDKGREEGVFIKEFPSLTFFHMIIGTFDQFLIGQFLLRRPPLGLAELNTLVDTLIRAVKVPDI